MTDVLYDCLDYSKHLHKTLLTIDGPRQKSLHEGDKQ